MRLLLSFLLLATAVIGDCRVYFEPGAKWETRYFSTESSSGRFTYVSEYAGEMATVDDETVMPILRTNAGGEPTTMATVKVEEQQQKVLFKGADGEWLLAYDFSLEPDRGCYIYNFGATEMESLCSKPTYMRCTAISAAENSAEGVMVMDMEEYEDETCAIRLGKGRWLKGIGSMDGVRENSLFGRDGVGSTLLEATAADGEVLYRDPSYAGIVTPEVAVGEADAVYDLQGRAVRCPRKGVYIRNGAKVFIP